MCGFCPLISDCWVTCVLSALPALVPARHLPRFLETNGKFSLTAALDSRRVFFFSA